MISLDVDVTGTEPQLMEIAADDGQLEERTSDTIGAGVDRTIVWVEKSGSL